MNRIRINLFCLCFVGVALLVVAGCSDGKLDTEGVQGTVTLDGVPVVDAMVNFSPAEGSDGSPSYGKTDEAGHYVLQTLLGRADAGTTPGEYAVTISKTELIETGRTSSNSDGTTSAEMKSKETLPVKYTKANTSGLTATVTDGDNTFDFELTK